MNNQEKFTTRSSKLKYTEQSKFANDVVVSRPSGAGGSAKGAYPENIEDNLNFSEIQKMEFPSFKKKSCVVCICCIKVTPIKNL